MLSSTDLPPDEARAFEHLQMLRNGVERDGEILRDVGDTRRTLPEATQDRSSCRIGDGAEDVVQPYDTSFTHSGEHSTRFERGRRYGPGCLLSTNHCGPVAGPGR